MEAERMVSVRPKRNILSEALSYVGQAWPYILGDGEESSSCIWSEGGEDAKLPPELVVLPVIC